MLWSKSVQPLSDARNFGHENVCKILEAHDGYDPVYVLTFFLIYMIAAVVYSEW